jgi:hypothetical protein
VNADLCAEEKHGPTMFIAETVVEFAGFELAFEGLRRSLPEE